MSESATTVLVTRRQPVETDLPTVADRLVEGVFKADTEDRPDHSFSGIMFDLHARQDCIPFQFVEIQSISVRGDLGPTSVYFSRHSCFKGIHQDPTKWIKVYGPHDLEPSPSELVEIQLDVPVRVAPNSTVALYVHSELPGDEAIVYADRRNKITYEDLAVRIDPGIAHVSNTPFHHMSPWGGSAWRINREFVGGIRYGMKIHLWAPSLIFGFPENFRDGIFTVLCCQYRLIKTDKKGLHIGRVPQMVMYHIFNFLPYDWFEVAKRKKKTSGRPKGFYSLLDSARAVGNWL